VDNRCIVPLIDGLTSSLLSLEETVLTASSLLLEGGTEIIAGKVLTTNDRDKSKTQERERES
jgi:hypothetical protein